MQLAGATVPSVLRNIRLDAFVAGKNLSGETFSNQPNQTATLLWDRHDVYGRRVQGGTTASIKLSWNFPMRLVRTGRFGYNGNGQIIDVAPRSIGGADFVQEFSVPIQRWDAGLQSDLGGWTLDVHHGYDLALRTLHRGDGSSKSVEATMPRVTSWLGATDVAVTPDGRLWYTTDGWPPRLWRVESNGAHTLVSNLGSSNNIPSLAAGPDGSVYASVPCAVWRFPPTGGIEHVLGNGCGYSVPGARGVDSPISVLNRWGVPMAVDHEGTLYYLEGGHYGRVLRALGTDGLVRHVWGTGGWGQAADGALAATAPLPQANGDVAVLPDGTVVVSSDTCQSGDGGRCSMRKVTRDGRVYRFAGREGLSWGLSPWSGEGQLATDVEIGAREITAAADGSILFGQKAHGWCGLWEVDPAGRLQRRAGTGSCQGSWDATRDLAPALLVNVGSGNRFTGGLGPAAAAPDGTVYFSRGDNHILKLSPGLPGVPGIAATDSVVPDGSEAHIFTPTGKHMRTQSLLTGATLRSFGYTTDGKLASITDGDGNTTTIERDGEGRPTAIVGPYGHRTVLATDANRYLSRVENPAGERHEFVYQADGLMTQMRTPRDHLYQFAYNASGRLIRDDDPAGGFQTLDRTGTGADTTVTRTTALGRQTAYRLTHSSAAKRSEATAPDGTRSTGEDTTSGAITKTSAAGVVTTSQDTKDPRFGAQGTMLGAESVRTPGGLVQTTSYGRTVSLSGGNPLALVSQTDTRTTNGLTTTTTYTASTRTRTTTSAAGRQTTTTLDAQGRQRRIAIPGLFAVDFAYDARGRLLSVTQGDRAWSMTYDSAGRVETVTDPLERVTRFAYDATDRVILETRPDGRQVSYGYDASGNLISLAPPGRAAHEFDYTPLDLESSYDPPPLMSGPTPTTQSYSPDRELLEILRPDATVVTSAYHPTTGQLVRVTAARGATSYTYHPTSGLLTGILTPEGNALAFSYDGALQTGTTWSGEISGSVGRVYDAFFRPSSTTVNGGSSTALGYDADGLLVTEGALTLTRNIQNGLVTGSTIGVITHTLTYSGFGEVSGCSAQSSGGTALYAINYTRDGLGRIATQTEAFPGDSHLLEYAYDLAGRLTDITRDGLLVGHYEYDPNGNRTLAVAGGATTTATFDAQDRIVTMGSKTYVHSLNGDLESKTDSVTGEVTRYQYDAFGNLLQVDLSDGRVIEYIVDGLNRRIGKKVDGVLVKGWLWESQLRIAAELDGSGAVVTRFVNALKPNVAEYFVRAGVNYRILTDHLGSPRLVVRADTGEVVQRMNWDEWGRLLSVTGDPDLHPYGAFGGHVDRDTGLIRFGARDYDAETGRWTTKDPIRFAGGLTSLYDYVGGDPVNRTDARGTDPISIGEWGAWQDAQDRDPNPPSERSCQHYEDRCSSTGFRYYCDFGRTFCSHYGEDSYNNCVRSCLIDADARQCSGVSSDEEAAECAYQPHRDCYAACLDITSAPAARAILNYIDAVIVCRLRFGGTPF